MRSSGQLDHFIDSRLSNIFLCLPRCQLRCPRQTDRQTDRQTLGDRTELTESVSSPGTSGQWPMALGVLCCALTLQGPSFWVCPWAMHDTWCRSQALVPVPVSSNPGPWVHFPAAVSPDSGTCSFSPVVDSLADCSIELNTLTVHLEEIKLCDSLINTRLGNFTKHCFQALDTQIRVVLVHRTASHMPCPECLPNFKTGYHSSSTCGMILCPGSQSRQLGGTSTPVSRVTDRLWDCHETQPYRLGCTAWGN